MRTAPSGQDRLSSCGDLFKTARDQVRGDSDIDGGALPAALFTGELWAGLLGGGNCGLEGAPVDTIQHHTHRGNAN